jgi:hypothetical protein
MEFSQGNTQLIIMLIKKRRKMLTKSLKTIKVWENGKSTRG